MIAIVVKRRTVNYSAVQGNHQQHKKGLLVGNGNALLQIHKKTVWFADAVNEALPKNPIAAISNQKNKHI